MSCCDEADCAATQCGAPNHNRYCQADDEFEIESTSEYIAIGQMKFGDWEKCERKRLEMLNEASDRASQMEQTMRWWAECTAMWRKKWSLVRNERNAARSTIEQLIHSLQEVQEDTLKYFEAKESAEEEIRRLKAEIDELRAQLGTHDQRSAKSMSTSTDDDDYMDVRTTRMGDQ